MADPARRTRDGAYIDQHSTVAVVYHYFEKDAVYRDNFIFFLARAWQPDLDFFIVISGDHSVNLPCRDNIRYIHTRNYGHDFGSYAELAASDALDRYDRLIFANCTVRGPFLPQYVGDSWTAPFLGLLTGDVHLCGATISILHDTRPYHALYRDRHPDEPAPYSHVQSSAHAMTGACFAFLKRQSLYALAPSLDKDGAVTECELRMSQLVRRHGWNISCLLPPYGALDYRVPHTEINPATKTGHPQAPRAYFGQTPHPHELVFIKTGWNLFPPGGLAFHSLMALAYHPRPGLDWAAATDLRQRLATEVGGPLAIPTPVRVTAAAPEALKSRCLMVLGMHRSGTSALAGALTLLGATPPATQMAAHASNPKGFFESIPVRDFNDRLLAAAGSSWKDWRGIDPSWFDSPQARTLQAEAVEILDAEFGDAGLFVLKDPRICRLLPFWRAVLAARGTGLLALHTHRHPQEVAGSLDTRYGFHPGFTHLLWLRHTLDAEAASRGLMRHFTSYVQLLNNPDREIARIALCFDLALPVEASKGDVRAFLSPELRNHRSAGADADLAAWYRDSLTILDHWAEADEDPAARVRFDRIRAALDQTGPIFGAILSERRAPPPGAGSA